MISRTDIFVLVSVAAKPGPWTYRSLAADLGMDPAALHRSVGRLQRARLLDSERMLNPTAAEEFMVHAVPYLLPAEPGPLGRGMPTAWGAPPLGDMVADDGEPPPVWPDPLGQVRGQLVEPIDNRVVSLVRSDPELASWFALVDGIRIGRAREKKLAAAELGRRILNRKPDR